MLPKILNTAERLVTVRLIVNVGLCQQQTISKLFVDFSTVNLFF